MKIQELRTLLSASDRAHLEKAFAECYKQLRKAQKEEIDSVLIGILEGKSMEKKILTDLYQLICEACNYYLFSTDDPFRSIGWEQPAFFELLVKKTFAAGYSRENISLLLLYATTGGLSREALHVYQEIILLNSLKTSDVSYMAMEEAKKLIDERTKKLSSLQKYDSQRYYLESEIDELCSMILLTAIKLAEPEQGIDYYFKHSTRTDKEITLYRALDLISRIDDNDLWMKVYEYGIQKKIKPRDDLIRTYEKLKKEIP